MSYTLLNFGNNNNEQGFFPQRGLAFYEETQHSSKLHYGVQGERAQTDGVGEAFWWTQSREQGQGAFGEC